MKNQTKEDRKPIIETSGSLPEFLVVVEGFNGKGDNVL